MDTTKLELGIIGDFLTGSFSAHPSPLKGEEGLGPRPGRFSDPSARADALKVEAVEDFTAEPPAPLDQTVRPQSRGSCWSRGSDSNRRVLADPDYKSGAVNHCATPAAKRDVVYHIPRRFWYNTQNIF